MTPESLRAAYEADATATIKSLTPAGRSLTWTRKQLLAAGTTLRPRWAHSGDGSKSRGRVRIPGERARRAALYREMLTDLRADTWPNGADLRALKEWYGDDPRILLSAVKALFEQGRIKIVG